jgi:YD repeat-containing protein
MVHGINELGESSAYMYNGLGALVENTWVIKKNAYGYHDVSALTNMVAGEVVVDPQTGKKDKKDKLAPKVVAASPELNKTSTVVKQFVVDYTSDTFEPLMEYEVNDLEYRYVYSNNRLSVNITGVDTSAGNLIEKVNQIKLYYHMDYLGTADYLTSPSESSAYIKTAIQSIAPFEVGDILLKWYTDNSYVVGNSMHDVDFSTLMAGLYEDMLTFKFLKISRKDK